MEVWSSMKEKKKIKKESIKHKEPFILSFKSMTKKCVYHLKVLSEFV